MKTKSYAMNIIHISSLFEPKIILKSNKNMTFNIRNMKYSSLILQKKRKKCFCKKNKN